ncbi:Diguanylate cyclase/phosphodiesterase [Crenothrix polyspora]|uniref:cyclic-guanylate-specific phosphodiesterase n=1 Tax=Crenothrix polyspora TaxID=360316 RepID=A0A1R4HI60_9GAMM|nr:bifunctional diguanylate cyclase/phosphodiesterase [Crenothrix polyspora]SJM95922.1 Diguanylate cyclase/phosphodiesterase [Crenothrix polyspora]
MDLTSASNLLSNNVKILKSEASKTAYQGVLIAISSILIATCLVSFYVNNSISLENLWTAQKNNIALWILDVIPFVFGIWGQHSSSIMAYQAGALIFDQTQELRNRTIDLEKHTNHVSTHDLLTDLPNRALFYDRVARAIASANPHNSQLSILLIEIENFKDVYDTLGRNSSDHILKQISIRLQGASAESDSVAKIDGNVFGILISNSADLSEAEQLAKHIQKAMEAPFVIDRLQVGMHANIGIVHFPGHGEDVDTLVQKAGVALHIAQKSAKGYALYELSFDKHTPLRLTLMSELRRAIEKNDLALFYQPKVSIQTNELYGAEALARWNHPTHGFIAPDEFIPMAERTRMIKQLTQWVLKRAFRDCATWHEQGIDIKISVNLSTRDLHDPDLPDLIAGIAAATGIKPEWIILEITESAVMNEPENALAIINRLHDMGYQFSIDDFGTGYSSLAYLKRLPLAELKIDKSFVMDLMNSENDVAIVKAIINLAHNLGLYVTAEGVETNAILEKLKEYNCDIAQGYYLSKPLPVTEFNNWVKKSKAPACPALKSNTLISGAMEKYQSEISR